MDKNELLQRLMALEGEIINLRVAVEGLSGELAAPPGPVSDHPQAAAVPTSRSPEDATRPLWTAIAAEPLSKDRRIGQFWKEELISWTRGMFPKNSGDGEYEAMMVETEQIDAYIGKPVIRTIRIFANGGKNPAYPQVGSAQDSYFIADGAKHRPTGNMFVMVGYTGRTWRNEKSGKDVLSVEVLGFTAHPVGFVVPDGMFMKKE